MTLIDEVARLVVAQQTTRSSDLEDMQQGPSSRGRRQSAPSFGLIMEAVCFLAHIRAPRSQKLKTRQERRPREEDPSIWY